MIKDNLFAIIMAGGKGERFWPQSRTSKPKQLLRLIGNLTLIEQAVERLTPLVKSENIIVITNEDYVAPMRSLLEDIPKENIIGEPLGKDTAPCISLAAAVVASKTDDPNAVMVVLPADHVINNQQELLDVISDCAKVAESGKIVTIGVNPTYPSTGYGYIKCGTQIETETSTQFYDGEGFREKPAVDQAKEFINAECYKWNSGMFVWSISTIMDAFRKHAPDLAKAADALTDAIFKGSFEHKLKNQYELFEKISIDYAVMEKVDNVVVAECTFDWDDVGSWTALRNQIRPSENNNVVQGTHIGLDTKDCIIVGDSSHLIATIDIDDLIIVHTEDATLICKSKSAQRVKEIVHLIGEQSDLKDYL